MPKTSVKPTSANQGADTAQALEPHPLELAEFRYRELGIAAVPSAKAPAERKPWENTAGRDNPLRRTPDHTVSASWREFGIGSRGGNSDS